jgi:hypothetical protein
MPAQLLQPMWVSSEDFCDSAEEGIHGTAATV